MASHIVHRLYSICIIAIALLCCSCQSLEPFPQGKYQKNKDVLRPYYESNLKPIDGLDFDSEQVSNKFLDPEMILALQEVNRRLVSEDLLSTDMRDCFRRAGLHKITIASAARTPWHQAVLSASYKAKTFSSMHSLGLAVDLEMNGKPFDIIRRQDDPEVVQCYAALSDLLQQCGLLFSEPQQKDANHVELMRYCRKSSSFDRPAWLAKNLMWWTNMLDELEQQQATRQQIRYFNRLKADITKEIELLE